MTFFPSNIQSTCPASSKNSFPFFKYPTHASKFFGIRWVFIQSFPVPIGKNVKIILEEGVIVWRMCLLCSLARCIHFTYCTLCAHTKSTTSYNCLTWCADCLTILRCVLTVVQVLLMKEQLSQANQSRLRAEQQMTHWMTAKDEGLGQVACSQ